MNPETPGYMPEEFQDEDSSQNQRPIARREMVKGAAAMAGAAAADYPSIKGAWDASKENRQASASSASAETEQKEIEEFEADLKVEMKSILGSDKLEDVRYSEAIFGKLKPALMKGIEAIEPVIRKMEESEEFKQKLNELRSGALHGSMLVLAADFLASKFFPNEPGEKRNVSRRRFLASLTGAGLGAVGSAAGMASLGSREAEPDLEMSAKRAALSLIDKYNLGDQNFSSNSSDPPVDWSEIENGIAGARVTFAEKLKLDSPLEQYSAIFHILDRK